MATQAVRLSTVVWTFAAALGAMQSGAREPDELWEMESLAQPPQTFDGFAVEIVPIGGYRPRDR